jgi:hypothetical protein
MAYPASSPKTADRLLLAFLAADDGLAAEALLARLIADHAEPLARGILGEQIRRSGGARPADLHTVDDVYGRFAIGLLRRLRELKEEHDGAGIRDFEKYVAVATSRAYYDHLRERFPREGEGGIRLAGLARWRGRGHPGPRRETVGPLARGPSFERRPVEFLVSLFEAAAGPVPLEELVDAVAELCGIRDASPATTPPVVHSGDDPAAPVHDRVFLRRLWAQIRDLPLRQRRVLLLSLSDHRGGDALELLPLTGVASLRQIAGALEMPAAELAKLWDELPLDDLKLAQTMELERQQVINLRLAARRRLARRMRGAGLRGSRAC